MKLFHNLKTVYDTIVITKALMKMCTNTIEKNQFVPEEQLVELMRRVNKNYNSIATEYTSTLPNPSLALRLSFFAHTLVATAVFHLQGNYVSSNKIANYYLDNIAPDTEDTFKKPIVKSITANEIRLVLLEKEASGMTDNVRESLEVIKANLFANKTGTGGHLGEIALCYFLMDNLDEAKNLLSQRLVADKGDSNKLLHEIYENQGLSNTKIGQEYFAFIEKFVSDYNSNNNVTLAKSSKPLSMK